MKPTVPSRVRQTARYCTYGLCPTLSQSSDTFCDAWELSSLKEKSHLKTPALTDLESPKLRPPDHVTQVLGRDRAIAERSYNLVDPSLRGISGHLTPFSGRLRDGLPAMYDDHTVRQDFSICDYQCNGQYRVWPQLHRMTIQESVRTEQMPSPTSPPGSRSEGTQRKEIR